MSAAALERAREEEWERKSRRVDQAREANSDDEQPLSTAERQTSGPEVVERNVAALEDGRVDCYSAMKLVLLDSEAYQPYFMDPQDPSRSTLDWAGEEIPTVLLEYPGDGATEKFALLSPKDKAEEYNPIDDIITTIRLVLDNFLTPAQALATFSHTPSSTSSFSAFLSAPTSRSATPIADSPLASTSFSSTLPPLMRSLEKARAKKDGPAFLAAVERYNNRLRSLKSEGKIKENIAGMKGLSEKIWTKIVGQVYERIVGPSVESLSHYDAFSNNVYGELLPRFMSEICQQTNLGPGSVFVDLGSGVGNCVVQAALATGCEAHGYENMAPASSLAALQLVEATARFRLWGVNGGTMRTTLADFCDSPDVGQVLRRADVVLVNNEVFSSLLNDRLSLLFLELRSDTLIVSLKAFASSFTISAYNLNSPFAMIDQGSEYRYGKKSVSWKDEGGTYWIGKVDRTRVERWLAGEKKRELKRKAREEEGV